MKARISIVGPIGEDPYNPEVQPVTMLSVVRQVESARAADELLLVINSPGGYIDEANAIYDYIKEQGKKVTTLAVGTCASIATKLFLLGETRLIQEGCFFMIHNPWNIAEGDADTMEEASKGLRDTEKKMAKEYAQLTGTSESAIKELMKQETNFTAQEAVDLGFATGIYKPMAEQALAIFKKKDMKIKNKSLLEKIKALVSGEKALMLNVASGPEGAGMTLEFPELEEGATPKEGDKATVDGQPAEGDFVLDDGTTYTFEKGALTKVWETESEEEISEEEMQAFLDSFEQNEAALKKANEENETLKADVQAKEQKITELNAEIGRLKALAGKGEPGGKKARGSASNAAAEEPEKKKRQLFKEEA